MPRKSPEQQLAELKEAEDRLKARKRRIQGKLNAQNRKDENRRKIIYGAVVLAHAEHDPVFAEVLDDIIDKHTTRDADREFLNLSPMTEAQKKRAMAQTMRRKQAEKDALKGAPAEH